MKYDVFISYSRKDKQVVQIISNLLVENGISFWCDSSKIPPGDEFYSTIVEAIKESRITLFVSSSNSNKSIFTTKEVAVAFNEGKCIIPYKIDASSFNKKLELVFSDLNWIEAYPFEYSKAVKLVEDIKRILNKNTQDVVQKKVNHEIIDVASWEEPQSRFLKFLHKIFSDKS